MSDTYVVIRRDPGRPHSMQCVVTDGETELELNITGFTLNEKVGYDAEAHASLLLHSSRLRIREA